MKRKRILTQYLLYFIMLMFLLVAGCSDSDDDNDAEEATVDTWVTISGTVTTTTGVPVSSVMMSTMFNLEVLNIPLFEGSIQGDLFSFVMTDANGYYEFSVPAALIENYTLVLTPSKKGYTFNPVERALTISTVDIPGTNFTAIAANEFASTDIAGTWRINTLRAGNESQWMRARIAVDTSGVATCLSMSSSDGTATCPSPFDLRLTMDNLGVITQSGAHALSSSGHMTMNSRKNLMAGTGTEGTNYKIIIAQKDDIPVSTTAVTSSHYSPADVQGKNFVFHILSVGSLNEWRYGAGATGTSTGATPGFIDTLSEHDSANSIVPTLAGTIAVDVNGVVTITGMMQPTSIIDFQGFLSADEKTIVGTYSNGTEYKLMVIQLTDGQTIDTMTGASFNHQLAVSGNTTPFWAYQDVNITRLDFALLPTIINLGFAYNMMLSYNWNLSLAYTDTQKFLLTSIEKINIGPSGESTILGPDDTILPADADTEKDIVFHGQLAFDGSFMVGVETDTFDDTAGTPQIFYMLNVITH